MHEAEYAMLAERMPAARVDGGVEGRSLVAGAQVAVAIDEVVPLLQMDRDRARIGRGRARQARAAIGWRRLVVDRGLGGVDSDEVKL